MNLTFREFVALIAPIAVSLRLEGSPIFPSVRIAQAFHETGGVVHPWNNLVGYKVGSGILTPFWKGRSVCTKTWEVYDGVRQDKVMANWRAYDSIEDCFRDQDILFSRSRYDRVRAAHSPVEQVNALLLCGYATDPQYAAQINAYLAKNLIQYDDEVIQVLKEIEELNGRLTELETEKQAPAPDWFVKEFGSADLGGIIEDPRGPEDFWRSIAVILRVAKEGKLGQPVS